MRRGEVRDVQLMPYAWISWRKDRTRGKMGRMARSQAHAFRVPDGFSFTDVYGGTAVCGAVAPERGTATMYDDERIAPRSTHCKRCEKIAGQL